MRLEILSERKMKEVAKYYAMPFAIISITCPDKPNVEFADNQMLLKILNLKFNDTDIDKPDIPAPTPHDFVKLKDFVDWLSKTECYCLFVHCGAGISRSAAVGAAINDYLHLGYQIFGQQKFEPNMKVYRLAYSALHTADVSK